MALNFPSNPSLNDTYSFGDRTWTWNGSAWQLNSAASGAINDIPIGNTTPSSGAFTTLSSSGDTTLGNISGNLIPSANVTYDLGSNTNQWNTMTVGNVTAGNILTDNYFYANGEPFVSSGGGGGITTGKAIAMSIVFGGG